MSRPKAFKRLLREAREAVGISKAEAARRLGLPYRTYQNYELGLRTPQGAFVKNKLIETLNFMAKLDRQAVERLRGKVKTYKSDWGEFKVIPVTAWPQN